ncbi:MAG TPA: cytochrome c biogenesis protein CcdA [Thermoanaerobacterales bacterium]|nr:cytochrome c biogenesis protein CcdA [Thermoanaerobacterales bacterium]
MLSFLSPCVLPLVPAYITFLAGGIENKDEKHYLFLKAGSFILGFSLIFIIMGASASFLGQFLLTNKVLYRKISGVIIILFGIHSMGLLEFGFLYREQRLIKLPDLREPRFASFVIGIAFAAGWTPCVGPILASILLYAGSGGTVKFGILLLTAYSVGLAVPFVITAFALDWFRQILKKHNKIISYISKISGIVLIIFGIVLYFDKIPTISIGYGL